MSPGNRHKTRVWKCFKSILQKQTNPTPQNIHRFVNVFLHTVLVALLMNKNTENEELELSQQCAW